MRSKRLNLAHRVVSLPCNNTSAIGATRTLASRSHGAFIGSRPNEQVVFYDPGLGTHLDTTALTAPGKFVQKILGSVEGRAIVKNIVDCYTLYLTIMRKPIEYFYLGLVEALTPSEV